MGNSSFKQKLMVLQGLRKICDSPQILVDLYLNYDCDMAAVSVFERIVNVCGRIAQGKDTAVPPPQMTLFGYAASAAGFDNRADLLKQDKALKLRGLVCLVSIVNSLVLWSQELALVNVVNGASSEGKGGVSTPSSSTTLAEDAGTLQIQRPGSPVRENSAISMRSLRGSLQEGGAGGGSGLSTPLQANAAPVIVNKHHLTHVSLDTTQFRSSNSLFSSSDKSKGLSSISTAGGAKEEDHTQQIEEVANRKNLLQQGVKLFSLKPVKAIAFFVRNKFVEEEAEAVAAFLKNTAALNKTAVGDYIGEGMAFNIKVMVRLVSFLYHCF
jgi:brefeldin A-inhibited guanine nucleotide-exchange protein